MTRQHTYRREIDACRPGSDDLQLPELAELARVVADDPQVANDLAASHVSDIALCDGLQEVPIPSGLADRLLAQLDARFFASAQAETATNEQSTDSEPGVAVADLPQLPASSRRQPRRNWLIAAGATAAALITAASIGFWRQNEPESIDEDQLVALSEEWYQQAASPSGWVATVDKATLTRFPIDEAVLAPPVRQRTMQLSGGESGVAYEVYNKASRRNGILLVIRTSDRYPVGSLFTSIRSTGGKAVGAWQPPGGYLYVLAVPGDSQQIKSFIRRADVT
jgi:hypothetical protein